MSALLNITNERGTTFFKELLYKTYPYPVVKGANGVAIKEAGGQTAPASDRIPVDVTGCQGTLFVCNQFQTTARINLLVLTSIAGGIVFGGADGKITLKASAAAMDPSWSKAPYRFLITFPDGTVKGFLMGDFIIG